MYYLSERRRDGIIQSRESVLYVRADRPLDEAALISEAGKKAVQVEETMLSNYHNWWRPVECKKGFFLVRYSAGMWRTWRDSRARELQEAQASKDVQNVDSDVEAEEDVE